MGAGIVSKVDSLGLLGNEHTVHPVNVSISWTGSERADAISLIGTGLTPSQHRDVQFGHIHLANPLGFVSALFQPVFPVDRPHLSKQFVVAV